MKKDAVLFAQKPAGISSHAPNSGHPGAMELLGEKFNEKLYPLHRLDKETSGCFLFSNDKETAANVCELFASAQVSKKYYFLSLQSSSWEKKEHSSNISKKSGQWTSDENANHNSTTLFTKVKQSSLASLYMAEPSTGKTHQIRLHAKDLGIDILGDPLYSDSIAPRMFLHCESMKLEKLEFHSPLPESFNLALEKNRSIFLDLVVAWEFRKQLNEIQEISSNAIRLYHKEDRNLSLDNYNGKLWFSDFTENTPWEKLESFFHFLKERDEADSFLIRKMINRGNNPENKLRKATDIPESWNISENSVKIELRADQGQSAGIFLDQRNNRKWVFQNSQDKKVLNLFSYTCAFSLMAAAGGASKVISVDTSKASLDWGRKNFSINELENKDKYLFFAMETGRFLKSSLKKKESFDLIVCDPPSFARNKNSLFRIEKDFSALLRNCWNLLSRNGTLLFTSNFEKWSEEDFLLEITKELKESYQEIHITPGFDYEKPGMERILKTFALQKR